MTAAWIAAVVFVAAGRPLAAQNSRWGADYFPNVVLTTHEGKPVRFYDDLIKGKIVAINLIYTTCKFACPLETARLAQVYRLMGDRMGRDVFFYSISIDPENDTPAVLKAYAEKFHAGPGWLFLTGKKGEIDAIGRKLGIYSDPGTSTDGHTPHLLIGNESTGQWIRNNGLDNPRFLATTIDSWLNSWQTAAKPTKSYADAPTLKIDAGEYAFKTHCAPCHTVGRGDQIGPDLLGVTTRRDRAWLTRFIIAPDRVIAEGDATATALLAKYKQVAMPSLGLATSDAELLLDYLAKQKAPDAAAPAPARPAKKGAADLASVVEPYLRIHRALSTDSIAGVRQAAAALGAAAKAAGPDAAGIRSEAEAFASKAGQLAEARAAFGALGGAIIRYAGDAASLGPGVKVAYCPMAGKYWLQRGDTLQNPFYGRAMAECGRFVAALPTGATW